MSQKAHREDPENTSMLCQLGDIQSLIHKPDAAILSYNRVLEFDPGHRRAHFRLARELAKIEEVESAQKHLMHLLDLEPYDPELLFEYARLNRFETDDLKLGDIEKLLSRKSLNSHQDALLNRALAKAYDDLDRHAEAFERARLAKSMTRMPVGVRFKRRKRKYHAAIAHKYVCPPSSSDQSSLDWPLVIAGPSCTGKTLLEKALSQQSDVWYRGYENTCLEDALRYSHRAGHRDGVHLLEPPNDATTNLIRQHFGDLLNRMGAYGKHLTCTNLENLFYVGVVLRVFPQSRVVLCRRHVLDTAVRMYFRLDPAARPFSGKLLHAVNHIKLFRKLTEHWHETFPDRTHCVDYEELVSNPDKSLAELMTFLGVDKNVAAESLSFARTEVDCWRNYEKQLRLELGDALLDTCTN